MAPRNKESSDWQVNYPEIKMRSAHLLRSREWTDCTFRFEEGPGSAAQSLEAHKLILAMASPVFAAMFYGNVGDKEGPILINDIEETTFSSMLNYIYTDEVDITSVEAACSLFKAANKYILVHLEKKCIDYLFDKLNPQNVCYVYELACLLNEDELIQKCLEIFSKNTCDILKSDSFKNAGLETVRTIYSLDSLNINSELDLFEALVEYTKKLELDNCKMDETQSQEETRESEISELPTNDETTNSGLDTHSDLQGTSAGNSDVTSQLRNRNVISSLLEHVRFLTLAPGEFAECKNLHKLLSEAEILALSMNISSTKTVITMPAGFSSSRLPRNQLDRGCSCVNVSIELKNILSKLGTSTVLHTNPLGWKWILLGSSEIFFAKNVSWKCTVLWIANPSEVNENNTEKTLVLGMVFSCYLDKILTRKVPWSCNTLIDMEFILNNNGAINVKSERKKITASFSSSNPSRTYTMKLPWYTKASHDVSGPVINDESIITVIVSVAPTQAVICSDSDADAASKKRKL